MGSLCLSSGPALCANDAPILCAGERGFGPQRGQPAGRHCQADQAQDGDAEQDAQGQPRGQVSLSTS